MNKFSFLIIAAFCPLLLIADPADLKNFDDPENLRYFKSHTIISAYVDKEFNFTSGKGNSSIYCLNDVVSNFSPDRVKKIYLKIKYENWIHGWLESNKELRLFFHINDNTGIPKLLGYSTKPLNINSSSEYQRKAIDLIDFTNVDVSTIESDTYVVGTLNPDINKIYPFVFKKAIVLSYPSDLKWRNIDAYISSYRLNQPISVELLHAILSKKAHQVVLKRVGDKYEVCGYMRSIYEERPSFDN